MRQSVQRARRDHPLNDFMSHISGTQSIAELRDSRCNVVEMALLTAITLVDEHRCVSSYWTTSKQSGSNGLSWGTTLAKGVGLWETTHWYLSQPQTLLLYTHTKPLLLYTSEQGVRVDGRKGVQRLQLSLLLDHCSCIMCAGCSSWISLVNGQIPIDHREMIFCRLS